MNRYEKFLFSEADEVQLREFRRQHRLLVDRSDAPFLLFFLEAFRGLQSFLCTATRRRVNYLDQWLEAYLQRGFFLWSMPAGIPAQLPREQRGEIDNEYAFWDNDSGEWGWDDDDSVNPWEWPEEFTSDDGQYFFNGVRWEACEIPQSTETKE